MEPVIASSNAQTTRPASEQGDTVNETGESAEQASESFLATIVRLDQSAAEQLFRAAKL